MLALLEILYGKLNPGCCLVLAAVMVFFSLLLLFLLEQRGMLWREKRSRSETDEVKKNSSEERDKIWPVREEDLYSK